MIRRSAPGVLANFCVKWGNKKVLSAIRISTLGVKRKNVLGAIRISALGVLANFCVKWGIKRKNVLGAIRTRNRLLRKQVLYPLSYEDVSD